MIEFEPTYVQEFNLYLTVRGLLTYSLCGVDLRSEGKRPENSMLICFATAALERSLSDPSGAELSMPVKVKEELEGQSSSSRENLLNFLKKVLLVLRDEIQLQKNEYIEMYNSLKTLLDKLISMNKEVGVRCIGRASRWLRGWRLRNGGGHKNTYK